MLDRSLIDETFAAYHAMRALFHITLCLWLVPSAMSVRPNGFSQPPSKEEKSDTAKIDYHRGLYFKYQHENPDKAFEHITEAIELSKQVGDQRRLYVSYLNLNTYYWRKGELDKSKELLFEIKAPIFLIGYEDIEATYYMESGIVNELQGNYERAISDFLKAKRSYKDLGDHLGAAKCDNNMANCYWEMEDMDKALEYYQSALNVYRSIDAHVQAARTLGNIGLIYRSKGDYKKALKNYHLSLEMNLKHKDLWHASIDLQNIGAAYNYLGKHGEAKSYFTRSLEIADSIGSKKSVMYASQSLAALETELGNYDKAIQGLQHALEMAEELGSKEKIKNIYESFANTYEAMGDFENALICRRDYEKWKDSLINESQMKRVKELEIKYETAEKDKQLALLANEKKLQEKERARQATLKQMFVGGFLLMALLAGLIFYILRQRLKNQRTLATKNDQIKTANFQQRLSHLELKALRAQMNPHFTFNCLNSINRMILEGDTEDASRYLTKFSKLIRLVLESSKKNEVPLTDELAILENYVQLESLRFKGKITYRTAIDPAIDLDTTYIPFMILQPLVENAIWHGLMPKKEGGTILITIKKEGDLLKCSVEDDGIGRKNALSIKEKHPLKNTSLGLQLVEERLDLTHGEILRGTFGIEDLRDSHDRPSGTRVNLLIPMA